MAAYDASATVDERGFDDVEDGAWYVGAVNWAVETGVMSGYEGGAFGCSDTVTIEQLCTILWRYECPEEYATYDAEKAAETYATTILPDGSTLYGIEGGAYYTAAVNWAVGNGIVSGYDNGGGTYTFALGESVYRARFAQMIYNAVRAGVM